MRAIVHFVPTMACLIALFSSAAHAASTTIIDNASSDTDALITMPSYTIRPLGKWTVVVTNERSISFKSIDGTQSLVPVVAELHPKGHRVGFSPPQCGEDGGLKPTL